MKLFDNRKDSAPNKTVEYIKDLLSNIGIETSVVSSFNNDNNIYSVRVEFSSIPGLGTNGKGVTEDFALASAYGEFMERLEGGFLIEQYYLFKADKNDAKTTSLDELHSIMKNIFSDYYSDESLHLITEYSSSSKNIFELEEYFDIHNGKVTYLPETLIKFICGSNGLCAGNTAAEALCQGSFELFERFALKKLFLEGIDMPNIDPSLLVNTQSYELVQYVVSKGYTCLVKDCSIGGLVPVIGILLVDPSKTKCKFALGADLNLDIALQRCLTEILQGYKFDFTFAMTMQNIINLDIISDNWEQIKEEQLITEMSKQMISGSGVIPLSFFSNLNVKKDISNLPFCNAKLSNEETFKKIIEIASNNKMEIYIKDYSYLGFPAYRVFMPNISVIQVDFEMFFVKSKNNSKLRQYHHCNTIDDSTHMQILQEINDSGCFDADYRLDRILGLIFNPRQSEVVLDTRIMELMLLYRNANYDRLRNKYRKYFGDANSYICLYLDNLANSNNEDSLKELFYFLSNDKQLNALNEFANKLFSCNFVKCFDCDTCEHVSHCYWEKFKPVYNILADRKKNYVPNYNRFLVALQ